MAFCGKCGNELREGANFCPKCGTPVGSTQVISPKTDGNPKWLNWFIFFLVVMTLGLGSLAIWLNFGDSSSSNSASKIEKKQETIVERPSIEQSAPIEEEKPSMQNDEEFQRKTMEYVGQIQQIMTTMNKIYNGYIASRSSDMMGSMRVNAQANLMELNVKGQDIFDKMIRMARQKKYQEAIETFEQEKRDFEATWRQMDGVLTQDMY